MRGLNSHLQPPEPFGEWSAEAWCPECDADQDHECVQWMRLGEADAYCLECSHEHTYEIEEPDVP